MAAAPNGDVYASVYDDGDIYLQTNGTGDFVALGQTSRHWVAMAAAPNGNVYAADSGGLDFDGGDIYMQTNGTGDFVALGQTSRDWVAMAAAPNGNVYAAVWRGDIYMQTNGAGAFNPLGQTNRKWYGMAAAPNGNVYAADYDGDIYMQTNGTGNFNPLGQTSRRWGGMAAAPNGDVYAAVSVNVDIYMQTNGTGNFNPLGQTSRGWDGMAAAPHGDVYAAVYGVVDGEIYIKPTGTGDFTLDFWVYPTAEPNEQRVRVWDSTLTPPGYKKDADGNFVLTPAFFSGFFFAHNQGTNGYDPNLQLFMTNDNTNGRRVFFQQVDALHPTSNTANFQIWTPRESSFDSKENFEVNKWNHVAIQRKNGKFNIALNGRLGKWAFDSNGNAPAAVSLNVPYKLYFSSLWWAESARHIPFKGYMDEFRFTKGTALWGSLGDNESFPPPTGDYPFPEPVPVITVSDPGGKTFNWGDDIPIRWEVSNVPRAYAVIKLIDESGNPVFIGDPVYKSNTIHSEIKGNYLWQTRRSGAGRGAYALPAGTYRVEVGFYFGGTLFSGESSPFTMTKFDKASFNWRTEFS